MCDLLAVVHCITAALSIHVVLITLIGEPSPALDHLQRKVVSSDVEHHRIHRVSPHLRIQTSIGTELIGVE